MTIDTMGCQRAIAQTIVDKKADYILALNLTRRAKSKHSIQSRRKVAAWDDEFLVSLIAA